MTSKSMRSFAAGLMVAASLCGTVYYLTSDETPETQHIEKPSDDEMKSLLTSKGYVIHTKEEWNEQTAAAKPSEPKTEDKSKETVIYRTMLTVSMGMTSIDVGKALENANVIKSSKEFFNEVEKRGVSTKLRPGTYEVESGMTTAEIISTIFKQ